MAEIGRWNGHRFEVSPSTILSFIGLQIKGSCETKDKKKSKQKYVTRKNGKPAEVSLTIILHAAMGNNVRDEALAFVQEAEAGKKDYFYVGNAKLLTCKLMLVDATVKETEIGNGSTWVKANVQITMKQCSKLGNTSGGGGKKKGKRNKKSVRSSSKSTAKSPSKSPASSKNNQTNNTIHFADHQELTKLTNATITKNANQVIRDTKRASSKYTADQKKNK